MDNDLNRRIAEALGQRVVMRAADDDLWIQVGAGTVEAYAPLPDYAGDLNAALLLPLAKYHRWDMHWDVTHRKIVVSILDGVSGIVGYATGWGGGPADIAAVAVRCWLAWKDQHTEPGASPLG